MGWQNAGGWQSGGWGRPAAGGGGGAGLAFDAASTAFLGSGTSSVSFTGPTVSASATKLVLALMIEGSSVGVGTITATYNAVSMTALATQLDSGGNASDCVVLFGITSPASGAHTIAINFTGTFQVMAGAVSFTGGDTSNTIAGAFPAQAASTFSGTTSLSLSPAGAGSGKALVAAWGANGPNFTAVSGTQLFNPGAPSVNFGAGNYDTSGAVSITATIGSIAGACGMSTLVA